MTDLDILDLDIKKLAVVRCLIQIINNDKMRSMYFERDLYDIINRYSADINRTFDEIKNKLQPAGLNTGGGVFGATGTGGSSSSAEASDSSDSGPFQYHSMNIPQVPIDNNNNNNDLNLDPLNLAGNNNNQTSNTNVQADADVGNPAVSQSQNVGDVDVAQPDSVPQVIITDYLAEIARRTQARNGQNPEAVRLYVGTAPAADPVASRDRILAAARVALRYLQWRCSHAYRAKFKDYMKINAFKDRHLIDRQIRKLQKFINWLEGTRSSRGHGAHRKTGDRYDQDKLEREANDAGVVIIQQNSPGREFSSASTSDMLRLKHLLLEKLKGKKYKNFDHIFEREFKKKFPNGTFTQKQGDDFVNELYRLFMNCIFFKPFNLGTLVSVNSDSGENLIMLGRKAVAALDPVSPARGGYLNSVLSLENRDRLVKNWDSFTKTLKTKQYDSLTTDELCALANTAEIPIEFSVQGDSKIYRNNVKVYSENHSSQKSSPAPILGSPDLSSTSYNLDDSTANSSQINNDSAGLATDNLLGASGSVRVPVDKSDSSLNSSTMPFNPQKFMSNIEEQLKSVQDLFGDK